MGSLVLRIVDLKDIAAYQLIVSVDIGNNGVDAAILMSGMIDVFKRGLAQLIFNVDVFILINLEVSQIFAVDLVTAIGGGVVDDDHEVVCIVLPKDGVQVELDPKLVVVVVACDDCTDG